MKLPLCCAKSWQLLSRDLTTGGIDVLVQFRPNRQPRLGRRVTNQVDHHLTAHQRPTAPVLRDVADHPVLDLVPLARPWREVAHGDAQSALIGKPLQLDLPQAATTPVRATAIGRIQYPLRLGGLCTKSPVRNLTQWSTRTFWSLFDAFSRSKSPVLHTKSVLKGYFLCKAAYTHNASPYDATHCPGFSCHRSTRCPASPTRLLPPDAPRAHRR